MPEPSTQACLVLHGLGGGPYELSPLIDALREAGIPLATPVLPGHEPSSSTMPASSWKQWLESAESELASLSKVSARVDIVGFSTGGTLALALAARKPVGRMVLLAPFLEIRYAGLIPIRPATYLRRLAALVPDLPRRPPAVRDPEMRRWASELDRFRTFNLHAAVSALELIDTVKPLVPSIQNPTLILQGRLDTVVEPANATWLYRHLGSAEKELVYLKSSDHLLALDVERADVIRRTLEFLGLAKP